MSFTSVTIIYNPNSTGPSKSMAEQLAAKLEGYQAPVKLVATEHAGHAEDLAYAAAKSGQKPLVVSSSGDGGYHEVINGAMRAQAEGSAPVTAVLPAGNANDHRRTLARAPLGEGILDERVTSIDLLKITIKSPDHPEVIRYAHSYIGLGLTPTVATELNRHTLNAMRELVIVVRAFWALRPFTIVRDGRSLSFDSLIFSNINNMAKALTIAKDGRPNDGLVEVTYFPAGHKLTLLARLLKAATVGIHSNERTPHYDFSVETTMPIQLDGEVLELRAGSQVSVSIAPRVLSTVL